MAPNRGGDGRAPAGQGEVPRAGPPVSRPRAAPCCRWGPGSVPCLSVSLLPLGDVRPRTPRLLRAASARTAGKTVAAAGFRRLPKGSPHRGLLTDANSSSVWTWKRASTDTGRVVAASVCPGGLARRPDCLLAVGHSGWERFGPRVILAIGSHAAEGTQGRAGRPRRPPPLTSRDAGHRAQRGRSCETVGQAQSLGFGVPGRRPSLALQTEGARPLGGKAQDPDPAGAR